MLFDFRKNITNCINVLRNYLSDIVYGATDGVITTFTIISGVQGAQLNPEVAIILGLVNLLADGLSMGASRFLSSRAESAAKALHRGYKGPLLQGSATFISFVLLGGVPLISYLIPDFTKWQFLISCITMAVTLLFIGILRAFVAKERWFQGMFETLCIGGLVSIFAYGLGHIIADYLKVN